MVEYYVAITWVSRGLETHQLILHAGTKEVANNMAKWLKPIAAKWTGKEDLVNIDVISEGKLAKYIKGATKTVIVDESIFVVG